MKKKFAPLALLFALLGALLVGGASAANATTGNTFDCDNVKSVSVVKVKCVTILQDASVTVKNIRFLNNNEILTLQNNLNNINVLSPTTIENVTINTLKNFNIIVTADDVNACVLAICK